MQAKLFFAVLFSSLMALAQPVGPGPVLPYTAWTVPWMTNLTQESAQRYLGVKVDTLAELQAFTNTSMTVLLTDTNRFGTFSRTTGLPVDGGVVFTNTAMGYVWQRQNVVFLDPCWFGAVPDGVTECSNALVSLAAVINRDGKGSISFRPGTYLCTTPTNDGYYSAKAMVMFTNLSGLNVDGNGARLVSMYESVTEDDSQKMFNVSHSTNVVFRNLHFVGGLTDRMNRRGYIPVGLWEDVKNFDLNYSAEGVFAGAVLGNSGDVPASKEVAFGRVNIKTSGIVHYGVVGYGGANWMEGNLDVEDCKRALWLGSCSDSRWNVRVQSAGGTYLVLSDMLDSSSNRWGNTNITINIISRVKGTNDIDAHVGLWSGGAAWATNSTLTHENITIRGDWETYQDPLVYVQDTYLNKLTIKNLTISGDYRYLGTNINWGLDYPTPLRVTGAKYFDVRFKDFNIAMSNAYDYIYILATSYDDPLLTFDNVTSDVVVNATAYATNTVTQQVNCRNLLINGAVSGKSENGIKLAGSATDYIYWDIPTASTNLTDFTVWARVYSPYRSSRSRFLKLGARHTDIQDTNSLTMGFNINAAPYGPVVYHTKNASDYTHRITTDVTNVVWGKVFDYTVRRSGSTWTVFVNGMQSLPTTYSSVSPPAANDALYVEYMSLGHGVGYYPSDDVIHAVGLWDRALTTAEVELLTVNGGRLVNKTDAVVFADFTVAPYNQMRPVLDPFYGTGIAGVSALGATSAITNLLSELNYDNTFYPASAAAPTAATGAAALYSATGTATKLTALDSAGLYGPVNSGVRLQVTNTVTCLATNTELLSAAGAAMNPVWQITGTAGGWTTNGLTYKYDTNAVQIATTYYTFTNVVRTGSRFKVAFTFAAPAQVDATDTTVSVLLGNTQIGTIANAAASFASSGVRVDGTTQTIVFRIVDTGALGTNCVIELTDASVMIQDVGDVVATVPVLANTLGLQGGSWLEFNACGTEATDTPVQFYVQGGSMTTPTAFGTAQTVNGNWRARARVFRGAIAGSVRGVIEWQDADGNTIEAAAQVALTSHTWETTAFYLDLTALATTASDVTLYGYVGETKQ